MTAQHMMSPARRRTSPARLAAIAWVLGLQLLSGPSADARAGQCTPARVQVKPIAASNYGLYEGRTRTHRILFVSERPGVPVDAFPEPPVRIIRRATGAACLIRDGGVWSGKHVYADGGGRRFLLLESSGSSAVIAVYDADTCARRAEIDVSEARWRFTDAGVEMGRQCKGTTLDECTDRQVTAWTADCTPVRP